MNKFHLVFTIKKQISEKAFPTISVYCRDYSLKNHSQIAPLTPLKNFNVGFVEEIEDDVEKEIFLTMLPDLVKVNNNTMELNIIGYPDLLEKIVSTGWLLFQGGPKKSLRRLTQVDSSVLSFKSSQVKLSTQGKVKSINLESPTTMIVPSVKFSYIISDKSLFIINKPVRLNYETIECAEKAVSFEIWLDIVRGNLIIYPIFKYYLNNDVFRVPFINKAVNVMVGQGKLGKRNFDAERDLINRLMTDGWEVDINGFFRNAYNTESIIKINSYIDLGWEVFLYKKKVVSTTSEVHIEKNSMNYFEVTVEVKAGQNKVPTEQIMELLLKRQNLVELGDSIGLLSPRLLNLVDNISDFGQVENGKIHVEPGIMMLKTEIFQLEEVRTGHQAKQFIERFKTTELPPIKTSDFRLGLRPYQEIGVRWLKRTSNIVGGGILADEMGLGKTAQILAYFCQTDLFENSIFLIICPKTLIYNWRDEISKFTENFDVNIYTGADRVFNVSQIDDRKRIIITSYQTLVRDIDKFENVKFDVVVLDEAQLVKNTHTVTSQITKRLNAKYRFIVTGTPVENSVSELWNHLNFINPALFLHQKRFMNAFSDRDNNDDFLKIFEQMVLRREKREVLTELPSKIYKTIYSELSDEQRELYNLIAKTFRESLTKQIKNLSYQSFNKLVLEGLLRLRQICCHPSLLPEELNLLGVTNSQKFEDFKGLIKSILLGNEKVIVFSQFTKMLDVIQLWLESEKIDHLRLDGKTKDRQELVKKFNSANGTSVMLISLKAGGFGLNLVAANNVVLYDNWWNPAVEEQAIDRTHRIGQEKTVKVFRFVTMDTVEEKIEKLKGFKSNLFKSIFSKGETQIAEFVNDLF